MRHSQMQNERHQDEAVLQLNKRMDEQHWQSEQKQTI